MTTVTERIASITWMETVQYPVTRGTPADALATREVDEDQTLWMEIIEAMLSWRSDSSRFDPADRPDEDILDSAIDYAFDQIPGGAPAPSNVVPSGSGRVAFEWNAGDDAAIVEFIDRGIAMFTRFVGDRVESKVRLVHNPRSRKLEIEG